MNSIAGIRFLDLPRNKISLNMLKSGGGGIIRYSSPTPKTGGTHLPPIPPPGLTPMSKLTKVATGISLVPLKELLTFSC
jgi:hypothetical protein